jgi:hypothetical protein
MIENIETAVSQFWAAIVTGVAGGLIWIVRRVFTNQKQIEAMQREFEVRDDRRKDDLATVGRIEKGVDETRKDIKAIHSILIGFANK